MRPSPHPRPLTLCTPPPAPHSTSHGRSLRPEPQVGARHAASGPAASWHGDRGWSTGGRKCRWPWGLGPQREGTREAGGGGEREKAEGLAQEASGELGAEAGSPRPRAPGPLPHTHAHARSGTRVHMDTLKHTYTHSLLHVHIHARHTYTRTCMPTRTHVSQVHRVSGYMWRHPRAHIHTHSHTHGHTHVCGWHTHVHIEAHTCTHMYTQCHASGGLELRSDTHTAQEASVGRLQPCRHPGEKQAQGKGLSRLRGRRERVCREVEVGRGGRGEVRRGVQGDGAARTGVRGDLSLWQATPDPRTEGGPHSSAGHAGPRDSGGTSDCGRPCGTLGLGDRSPRQATRDPRTEGGLQPAAGHKEPWDRGTSARGRPCRTPGQRGDLSLQQATRDPGIERGTSLLGRLRQTPGQMG